MGCPLNRGLCAVRRPHHRDAKARPHPLRPRQRLGLFERLRARQRLRSQPPAGEIVEVEVLRDPAVGEADFEAAAARNGFMLMMRMRAVITSPLLEKHGVGNQTDTEHDARDSGHVEEVNKSFVKCHTLEFAPVERLF